MSEEIIRKVLESGQVLIVKRGDITAERVDAIVNAANSQLKHGGGLARAIVRAGGNSIQEESDLLVRTQGPVPTGQAAVTGAGNLPAKYVIHAVGPVWEGGNRGEPQALTDAVLNSLRRAEEKKLRSVAIPAISTGIFGYPKAEGTERIVAAAIEYFQNHPLSSVREVRFVAFDAETAEHFRRAMEKLLGQSP